MNNLTIKRVKDGDTCKCLGIDKNISYVGTVNKERVKKESLTRVTKFGNQNFHLSKKSWPITLLLYLSLQPQ